MRNPLPLLFSCVALLSACGGGGGGSSSGGGSSPPPPPVAVDRVVLTASAPTAEIGSGSVVPFEFLVTNPSTSAATNVTLTPTFGAGLRLVDTTCEAAGGATCPSGGATTVASLPANGSLRFKVNALLAAGSRGAITSSGTVTADNDGVTTNNLAQAVITAFSIDLRTSSTTAATDTMAGSNLAYSMTISNGGPDRARDIVLENIVGTGQSLVSITCTSSGGGICPAPLGSSMNLASLPNGAALVFTVTTSIDQDAVGIVSNTLRASAAGDTLASNNVATGSSTVQIAASRQTPSFVMLKSDTGDLVGRGASYAFDRTASTLRVTPTGNRVRLEITGSQNWTGDFALPAWMTEITAGMYANAVRYPAGLASSNAMNWSIDGRSCDSLTGYIRIDKAIYIAGALAILDLRFEQRCDNGDPALRGQIHWVSANLPPGPVNPPPTSLWAPPAGATPATGNYIYLEGDAGDFIVGGRTHLYTQTNSILTLQPRDNYLAVFVNGDEHWSGDFKGMVSIETLQAGYYGNLGRYPFGNPNNASLSWNGEGRGCNDLTGWFVIDSVTYSGTALASIDLRFEQHCEGQGPAMRGKIHWTNGDTTQPVGPQVPPPAGLWQPAPGETPTTGNYLYLIGDLGDYILNDASIVYTQADSKFILDSFGAQLGVRTISYEFWQGDFVGMNTLQRLQVGYYPNVQRAGSHNPTSGGMSWSGEGRGCNTVTGWFAIDSITYTDGAISAIDIRFEQHCDGRAPALRGKLHWAPGDTTRPPGPVNPPPATLWQPAPGTTPASGNYVYLESEPGDYVGGGENYTLTLRDSLMEWRLNGNELRFYAYGDTNWSFDFKTMDFLPAILPGFYPNLLRNPFHNPVIGGFSVSGDSRGCNQLYGWVVIDSITIANDAITAIDLRFEQHCEYWEPALRGKIHWRADDPTRPPGPVTPPPAGLWSAPAGATPASGNYIYLESSSTSDYIGFGMVETYTPATNPITFTTEGPRLSVHVGGSRNWFGRFVGMSFLSQLQPGYYGGLSRNPLANPVKGDVDWSGEGRGCNFDAGWFVIDSISYVAGQLKSVDLRFEQRCEQYMPPLHGQIHWVMPSSP